MLSIRDLAVSFSNGHSGSTAKPIGAVRGISFDMAPGELLGLVGESGSGKTVTALTIAGLIERGRTTASGDVIFCGENLLTMSREQLRKIQGRDIGFVFQEPMTSLNPLMKIGRQIEEPLKIHLNMPPEQRRDIALEAMRNVGLPEPELMYSKYPHQLSGGQRQRVVIASAIILGPKLLIADEPTTALDVTVQAQIISLLRDIHVKFNVGILFISHNLAVVRKLCSRVIVMHEGLIAEEGDTEDIFKNPENEYTRRLIAAIPTRDSKRKRDG